MAVEAPYQNGLAEPTIVAVDGGATKQIVQIRQGDMVLGSVEYPTPRDYERAIISIDMAATLLANGKPIDGGGFAMAGKIADGQIASAGKLKEYGWCKRPFRADVAQQMGIKETVIILMGDCTAAAFAQRTANRKAGDATSGYTQTISTGWGGAGFTEDGINPFQVADVYDEEILKGILPDEPGHEFLKQGAICGCGNDGCAEAWISGSGIEGNRGVGARDLPLDKWPEVIEDAVEAHVQMLQRFDRMGFKPAALHFFGSVALKHPKLMLPGIRSGLGAQADRLPFIPEIVVATHGDNSGLIGAGDAALELIRS